MAQIISPGQRQKEGALDVFGRALQAYGTIQNIRANSAQMDELERKRELETQKATDEQAGRVSKTYQAEKTAAGGVFTAEPTQNSVKLIDAESGAPIYFSAPKKQAEFRTPDEVKDLQTKDGSKVYRNQYGYVDELSRPLDRSNIVRVPEKPAKDISVTERNTLQNQYDRDPQIRKNKEVFQSYNDAIELSKDPSPASDQALIYSYMKALDPGSVVRETEAETAAAIGGLQERAKAQYARLAGDAGLSDEQRADIVDQIRKKAKSAMTAQQKLDEQFSGLAKRRNISTEDLRLSNYPQLDQEIAKQDKQIKDGQAGAASGDTNTKIKPGITVNVKGKKYIVGPDGDSLIPQ